MASDITTERGKDRRAQPRGVGDDRWQTALTSIAPNKILIRGYPLDEMMGRLSFAEAVYLLLMGELPTAAIGRMFNAILVSSIDHGVTPPSTLAARNVATSGAPMKDCVAAGILAFGPHHGADLGFAYELGNAMFLVSRLPGLIAHAHEERTRQTPMRQIDPKDHDYDGSGERRLPGTRK